MGGNGLSRLGGNLGSIHAEPPSKIGRLLLSLAGAEPAHGNAGRHLLQGLQ